MPINISYGRYFKRLFNDQKYILAYFIFQYYIIKF